MVIGINSLVPLAGIEPALLAELDFESSASTNSATGARAAAAGTGGISRRPADGQHGAAKASAERRPRYRDGEHFQSKNRARAVAPRAECPVRGSLHSDL